jgi:hypothetical protein
MTTIEQVNEILRNYGKSKPAAAKKAAQKKLKFIKLTQPPRKPEDVVTIINRGLF